MELNGFKRADFEREIEIITRHLIEAYKPERLILFGSCAWGVPDENSDVDMLIVKETDESYGERWANVRRLVRDVKGRIPFQPLVLTASELQRSLQQNNSFVREIMETGKVLFMEEEEKEVVEVEETSYHIAEAEQSP